MKGLINLIICSLLFAMFVFLAVFISDKQEKKECINWKIQAEEYPNFKYSDWMTEQCSKYNLL